MKRVMTLTLLVVLGLSPLATRAGADAPEDESELESLLNVMAEETAVATRNRQNADYVPGIVSVLTGDEAIAKGAGTVLDALALIPGIEINRTDSGGTTLRVRGMDAFFSTGNVKILVDGLDVSFAVAEQNTAMLLMPLELVDRVEVIRGPGSGIYGDYALNGLVNIVTHKDRDGLYLEAARGGGRHVGATVAHQGDLHFSANAAHESSNRYDSAGQDPSDEQRTFGAFEGGFGGFGLKAAGLDRTNQRLVPSPQPGRPPTEVETAERVSALEARYDWRFGGDNRVGAWVAYSSADKDNGALVFDGHRDEFGADWSWRFGTHLLLAQVTAGGLSIDNQVLAPAPPPPPGVPQPPGHRPTSVSTRLDSQSALVQDQFDLGPRFSVTAGLRYDKFADVDSRVTPRLAAVWRLDDRDTLKAQYAEGFRTPVATELYDSGTRNTDLGFVTVRTLELGYIHRTAGRLLRATLFRSEEEDLLTPKGPPGAGFRNAGFVHSSGVELEWSEQLRPWLKLDANVTKVHTDGERPTPFDPDPDGVEEFGAPDLLANLGFIARPDEHWTLGANLNHVGDRANPPNDDLEGYDAVSVSVEHRFAAAPQLTLRGQLRNAFNGDITYVLSRPPPNPPAVLDYGARIWSLELAWRF